MISPRGFCAGGIGGIGTPRTGTEAAGEGEGGALVTGETPLGDVDRDGGGERNAPAERMDPIDDCDECDDEEVVRRSGAVEKTVGPVCAAAPFRDGDVLRSVDVVAAAGVGVDTVDVSRKIFR